MPEKDIVFNGKVKHDGVFNFKDFYDFMYFWFLDEEYDLVEKSYSESVSGDSKNLKIAWEADKKVSDYFKFRIKVSWVISAMKSIETQRDGKKVKANSGILELRIQALLVKDYEGRWENKAVWKFLRGVYDRYIIRSRIEEYEIKLFEEVSNLIDQCKAYLELESKK